MRDLTLFESALRAAVPTQPDPRIGAELVPRLAEAARASTTERERRGPGYRPRPRRALVARVGIVVALIPLVLAGLAFAGVTVPTAARSAFDSIGITLPNQPAKHRDSATTTPAPTATEQSPETRTGTGSREPGKSAVPSKGKSAAAHAHALQQRMKAQGKALGHERGKAVGLNGSTPPGQSGQTGPPPHSNAGGSSSSHGTNAAPKPHPTPAPQGNANGHSK